MDFAEMVQVLMQPLMQAVMMTPSQNWKEGMIECPAHRRWYHHFNIRVRQQSGMWFECASEPALACGSSVETASDFSCRANQSREKLHRKRHDGHCVQILLWEPTRLGPQAPFVQHMTDRSLLVPYYANAA
mmetsp:Transcript_61665/g.115313  ORF Transcript_61665/g.115313 Transcript_61665/m.115313 type:complete len:131 (+) Transcript_61665:1542-1934(+)